MTEHAPVPARADDVWTPVPEDCTGGPDRACLKRRGARDEATSGFRPRDARARDAVYETLDEPRLVTDLKNFGVPVVSVLSAAPDRKSYLMQPDLGRT